MGLFLRKIIFQDARVDFSSKLDWGSYIISIAKSVSKKIGALLRSMKFLSPEVTLFLCKSTILQCMEHCCHAWGLVLLAAICNCWLSYKNGYEGLLVLHLLPLLTPSSSLKCSQLKSFP